MRPTSCDTSNSKRTRMSVDGANLKGTNVSRWCFGINYKHWGWSNLDSGANIETLTTVTGREVRRIPYQFSSHAAIGGRRYSSRAKATLMRFEENDSPTRIASDGAFSFTFTGRKAS